MIIDIDGVDSIPLEGSYDVCIAGGGVAGIVLARSLANSGKRVLLLEGGSLEYTWESQGVYSGTNVGMEYFDLDITRLRFLGGSSNHWFGWCRPLDADDFERHDHIPDSGWPIGQADVEPYLAEAREILELDDFPSDTPLPGSDLRLKDIYFRSSPPVLTGQKYFDFLDTSDRVDLLLNANLVDIRLDPDTGRVTAFLFRGYKDGAQQYEARAGRYVLALGGIENARALLNASGQVPAGVGNSGDMVGRHFMEHPYRDAGYFILTQPDQRFDDPFWHLSPTLDMKRREQIANARFVFLQLTNQKKKSVFADAKQWVKDGVCETDILADWIRTIRPLRCHPKLSDLPQGAGRLVATLEQVPNPSSRITLSEETDRFGLRRVALDWQYTPMEKKTLQVSALEVAKYFAAENLARVKLYDWVLDADDPGFPPPIEGGYGASHHHMGTTRMGTSARDGVVDQDCRVFDSDNLYIAGSSVFRTSGHANPTLAIVQMTLRLADHLAQS